MNKIIGITASRNDPLNAGQHRLNMKYTELLIEVGYTPILIPVGANIENIVKIIDGIIFSGGADIWPGLYNENVFFARPTDIERDKYELQLYEKMKKTGKPILGICRGFQLFLIAEGFKLAQDLEHCTPAYLNHTQNIERVFPSHYVMFDIGQKYFSYKDEDKIKDINLNKYAKNELINIFGKKHMTNSMHHQGIHIIDFIKQFKQTNKNITILGIAEDGVIEAIKVTKYKSNILAVQFHIEETKDIKLIKRCFE